MSMTTIKIETKIVATIADNRNYIIPKHHAIVVQNMCAEGLKIPAVRFIMAEYELHLLDAKHLTEELVGINPVYFNL